VAFISLSIQCILQASRKLVFCSSLGIESVQWRSDENPYFPKDEYERQKKLLDPRIFDMKYNGTFARMAGLVYMDFKESMNITPPGPLPAITPDKYHIFGGIDFGYNHPFALVCRAIARDGSHDYQTAEFSQSFLDPVQQVSITKQFMNENQIEMFYADSADPGMIDLLNKAGIVTSPVKKGPDSIVNGIGLHQSLIRTGYYKLFRGKCPNTLDELEQYHYPEDKGLELGVKDTPVDAYNDLLDANRYVTMMTQALREQRQKDSAFVPDKTRLERLLDGEMQQNTPEGEDAWFDD